MLFCLSFNLISSWFILKPRQLVLTSLHEFHPPANSRLQVRLENENFVLEFPFLSLVVKIRIILRLWGWFSALQHWPLVWLQASLPCVLILSTAKRERRPSYCQFYPPVFGMWTLQGEKHLTVCVCVTPVCLCKCNTSLLCKLQACMHIITWGYHTSRDLILIREGESVLYA